MIGFFAIATVLVLFASLAYALGLLTLFAVSWRGVKARRQGAEKAAVLLRSWLTPEQAKQWDSLKEFYVIGSDTGTRYRVRYGHAMNIDEFDDGGEVVAAWCFGPRGDLAVGDVMLAQKIALETMELGALAVAVRSPGR